jgi:glycosyltransferase involved in cell wall biosynthesis
MHKLHIALVTTFPPGQGSLNEYAYHFVRFLQQKPEIGRISLLVDQLPPGQVYQWGTSSEDSATVEFYPCWRFNSLANIRHIVAMSKMLQPDIMLFNLQFATFGEKKVPAALGLLAPCLVRMSRIPTVVLLHNLVETVNLKQASYAGPLEPLIRIFGTLVTRLVLASNLVAVTIPRYVEILQHKYHVQNVLLAPHGAFEKKPLPSFDMPDNPPVIMTFGKFGTYKRVETLIGAFQIIQASKYPDAELVIAGTDSPKAPGYLNEIKQRFAHISGIRFIGYVPEEDVPTIFANSTLVVFPYISTTGSSGVLHQAGEYGRAAVLPHIGDFADIIAEEGYTGKFFEPDNPQSLADAIIYLLDNPDELRSIASHNYTAARGLPMEDVIDWYVMHFQDLLVRHSSNPARAHVADITGITGMRRRAA